MVGVAVIAFLFDVTRDKLMQMAWFRRLYDRVMWLHDWAHIQVEPLKAQLRRYAWLLHPPRAVRFMRRLIRLRRWTQGA